MDSAKLIICIVHAYYSKASPEATSLTTIGQFERVYIRVMRNVSAAELVGEEWAEWYCLTPAQRFVESMKLWDAYLALGGSLEPEPDTQSPFFDADEWRENAADGRASVRLLRSGGV